MTAVLPSAPRGLRAAPRTPRARAAVVLSFALAAVLVTLVLSLAIGNNLISPARVIAGIFGTDQQARDIVVGNRLPRTLLGILVGAALGLAGHLMQSITRNPLADPGLLGIEAGAAAAVVSVIAFLHITDPGQYIWFALVGAGLATVVVYALGAGRSGGASPVRLLLAGAAISACLFAFVSGLLVSNAYAFATFRFWVIGSLTGRDVGVVGDVVWFLIAGLLLALLLASSLNAVALGDEVAAGLGASVRRTRLLTVLCVALLTGAATAAAGPIGFVGLAVPHLTRALVGSDHRWGLPLSAMLGIVMLQSADIVGRIILWPQEIGVGIVTAVIGAPTLILLVRRNRLVHL